MTTTLSGTPSGTVASLSTPTPSPANQGVLEDLYAAVGSYVRDYLTIDFFSVNPVGGGAINEGDEVTFRLRVHNSGPLDVVNLQLHIKAEDNAKGVKRILGTSYVPFVTTDAVARVKAYQPDGTWTELPDTYSFQADDAPKDDDTPVALVTAWVHSWDGDLTTILIDHAVKDKDAKETYSHKVLRS